MRQILKTALLMAIALVCSITVSAQAPIKKPEKKQQTTHTTTTKPRTSTNTNKSSQTRNSTKVSEPTGYINGHGYVDLGLSVKWATCNVGASSTSDYGNYYAWGETSTKSSYTEANSKTYGKRMGSIANNSQYDVAQANWGDTWRLPTADEIEELVDKCEWIWTTIGGHYGYMITGPNGNSIFLPAAGWRNGTSLGSAGELGFYWSATSYESGAYHAYALRFGSVSFFRSWYGRYNGQSVRPVSDSDTSSQSATTSTNKNTTTTDIPKPKTDTNTRSSNITTTATAPKSTTGTINGHEWVDLGLSVKWATCNIGALSPSDYGNYYAWGETSTKTKYKKKNSKTYGKSMGSIAGNSQYDAARANWGSTWRLPTWDEIDELVDRCTWTCTTQGGHMGYKITGPNGNSIFLPAAGWRTVPSLDFVSEYGYYWSATPLGEGAGNAYCLEFCYVYNGRHGRDLCGRYYGLSVRPVSE